MEIMIKTILWQIITLCAGTQDIIKKLLSCDPCVRKSGLKTVGFLLRLSINRTDFPSFADGIAKQRPDMNIKVNTSTVSKKFYYMACENVALHLVNIFVLY